MRNKKKLFLYLYAFYKSHVTHTLCFSFHLLFNVLYLMSIQNFEENRKRMDVKRRNEKKRKKKQNVYVIISVNKSITLTLCIIDFVWSLSNTLLKYWFVKRVRCYSKFDTFYTYSSNDGYNKNKKKIILSTVCGFFHLLFSCVLRIIGSVYIFRVFNRIFFSVTDFSFYFLHRGRFVFFFFKFSIVIFIHK